MSKEGLGSEYLSTLTRNMTVNWKREENIHPQSKHTHIRKYRYTPGNVEESEVQERRQN